MAIEKECVSTEMSVDDGHYKMKKDMQQEPLIATEIKVEPPDEEVSAPRERLKWVTHFLYIPTLMRDVEDVFFKGNSFETWSCP